MAESLPSVTWQPYGLSGLAILAVGALVFTGAQFGWSADLLVGIAAGAGLGLVLMILGLISLRSGLKSESKTAALGHVFGGFGLRMLVLVAGVGALVYTKWANPAGFALAFLAMVMLYLGLQVHFVNQHLNRTKST